MEVLLFLFLLIQVLGQTQNKIDANAAPDIEVGKFSWSHRRGTVAGNSNSRSMTANPVSRQLIYRREIENRNSIENSNSIENRNPIENRNSTENPNPIENRSRDLRNLEESVVRESVDSKAADTYEYRVELRNRGTKVIK